MTREKLLRIVLILVGLLFVAGVYPLITSVRDGWRTNKEDALPMGISVYVTLGVFLLVAARNPSANRSVITFGGWANLAHAGVMTIMAIHLPNERQDLFVASTMFGLIGVVLVVLAPGKRRQELASTT